MPAGVFNQFSGIPLNKQIWFSFWDASTAPNDSGIAVNHMGSSTAYNPVVFADGSVADLDLYIIKSAGSTSNLGASAPTPKDFNQIGYNGKYIRLYWDAPGTCSVYIIYRNVGGTLNWTIPGGGGSGVLPVFYPVTPDLKFEDQFNVTLAQDQQLSFSGSGNTFIHGFIVVVP